MKFKMLFRDLLWFIIGFITATIILYLIFSIGISHVLDHIQVENIVVNMNETKMIDYIVEITNNTI